MLVYRFFLVCFKLGGRVGTNEATNMFVKIKAFYLVVSNQPI